MTSQQAFASAVADSRSRAAAQPKHVSTASVVVNGRTVYAATFVNGVAVATKGGR